MRLSLIGIAFPVERSRATSAAHANPVSAPQRQAVQALDSVVKPTFQCGPFFPFRQDENAEAQFSENNGIDGNVPLMDAKPSHHTSIGGRPRRLTQNVGVNPVLQSESVDSEAMGTKKSFCGQASSHSMAPSFGGSARRTSR
jgi:hypothetical protein